MTKVSLDPVRGMRDVLYPESELLTFISEVFEDVAVSYGYRKIITPTIERFELFALKSGEEIRNSMYVFVDKGGREVALRPEFTPSVVRAYLRYLKAEPKPIRLYYVGSVFRYDEPQRGRYREFTQAGVEVIGADGIHYDVELILLLDDFYKRVGLRNYEFKINNIAVIRRLAEVAGLGSREEEELLHLLDKGLVEKARELVGSRNSRVAKALEVLNKHRRVEYVELSKVLDRVRGELNDLGLTNVVSELDVVESVCEQLSSFGVKNFFVDLGFARGIAYYTGMIFEVVSPSLGLSIAGGGRYDNLTCVYGGSPEKMTGFAIGVERTALALMDQGFELPKRVKILALAIGSVEAFRELHRLASLARSNGFVVQVELCESKRLSRMFEYAARKGFDYVAVIGRRELERGTIVIKDLARWSQIEVPQSQFLEVVSRGVGAR